MNATQFELSSRHGRPLYARRWAPPAPPSGAVGIVHGLGEHSGRYGCLASQLVDAGMTVVAYDQRGHGQSDGARGHVHSYQWLLDDIESMMGYLQSIANGRPIFLFGHSLGGNLVLNYLLRRANLPHGAVVCSPLLRVTVPPPAWQRLAGGLLNLVWPSFTFRMRIDANWLSRDAASVAAYQTDPLVHGCASARLAVQMFAAGEWALAHAAMLRVPTLLMHGTADPLTSCPASELFAQAAAHQCSWKRWPELRHELHWEIERQAVIDHIVCWLRSVRI